MGLPRCVRYSGDERSSNAYNPFMRIATILLALCVVGVSFSLARADAIEGTSWKIRVTPDGDGKAFDDTITFKGGKFTSVEFTKRGFDTPNYEDDTRQGGLSNFKVEQKSAKAGEAKWTGTITAVDMRGELVVTKKDGSTVNYTFQGERLSK
ncbi:hypothetical protein BH09PLA1_BH09PLA1_34420 [soil metagenome]